ncbi:MAG TPA: hypothetical protein VN786_03695 [Acidimicrobiales bacterium]|nr:hypothetical protein [Acidimicrobiales bacterium]
MHLAVVIVAPACALAGWWQATRALAGNGLSWVYSVEWPIFALIAIAGWWQLVHEDPEAYKERKSRPAGGAHDRVANPTDAAGLPQPRPDITVERATARLATIFAILVGSEFLLGIMTLFSVPVSRPSGGLPAKGEIVFLVHAVFGFLLALASIATAIRLRAASRAARIAVWMGFSGVALAGVGGLLTDPRSLLRFTGMALMFVGAVLAGFGYLVPLLLGSLRSASSPQEKPA